ncbi:MAG: S8 family serine peptidase, partial [Gammaproteobacteria bacterium]|nr:S8 family serine peptidase [Gammaproteobacteria bacterium]
ALIEPRDRRPGEAVQMSVFDIRVHTPSDLGAVTEWLTNQNVTIAGSSNRKIRIYLPENSRLLDQIAALTEVSAVQEYVPPKLSNDAARRLIGVVDPNANPNDVIAQRGANQIVGVADSGVDENHPDFQGRIIGLIALGRPNDPSDPHGHGTHVAGSVLGDGAASNSEFAGVAPDAELFFQSLLDASGGLGGLPVDLGNMFEEAYTAGARIHNNSWGADTEARYTFNSEEVDEFVWNHKDMLIVIAAGNDGRADANLHASSGFVDWLSVGSPATAKNALTVGASRSDRTTGGYSQITYGLAWPQDFPQPPIANENISGDPLEMAGFSSRGPSDDRRIKPDVVAPGTDIISAKASTAPLGNFWGAHANGQYAYMGGTSMAAPIVSGCATLARQYYIEEANWATPSAALLKATIINSARWLSGQHSQADNAMPPNYHQGFGQIFLPDVLPHPAAPHLRLEFIDSWQNSQHQFTRVGQRFRFNISVDAGLAFKICVVWTDRPGRGLQNSLGLILEDPLGAKHVGNTGRLDVLTTMDRDNNAQIVRFDNPAPGDYMIFLSAINLLAPPQDFALVVSGHLTSSLNEV